MRSKALLAAWAALGMVGAVPAALAQVVVTPPVVAEELGPDDEIVVREYIVRRAPPPVRFEQEVVLRPGSLVPRYVDLEPMAADSDPRLRRFAYFISPNDKIVVVDPATRAVVRILDR